ncbi:Coiled-coil domain-containing protein 130 homolog [Coccomyxa sp. Obi]|nr:Coiled-coil domain-containing protein 130 homolog [Coccomyxa sp. Obi]
MSTLAAARADNFYYPPEWDPSKGGLNKFQGQHPLRERAKKLDQGILVIRFEMPFNVWCNGCGHLIGKGVRFNAEKKQIGSYFSTKIWSFSMTAPCCSEHIEVQTDPKNHEYIVVAGARRKAETYTAEAAETLELPDSEEAQAKDDPFSKLERRVEDRKRGIQGADRLAELLEDSEAKMKDDYTINKALRRQLRSARKEERGRDDHRKRLGLPDQVRLLPESGADAEAAALVSFGHASAFANSREHKRQAIKSQPIFSGQAARGGSQQQAPVQRTESSLRVRGGVKGKSTLDKAALLLKRRRMDASLKLGMSAPGMRN